MKKPGVILFLGSGGMAGVFSGGVVSALQESNIYNEIEAIYATSCGCMNGAYFLTKQTTVGSSIYYEDLIKDFIRLNKIPAALGQRMFKRTSKINNENSINIMQLSVLEKISRGKKALDQKKLKSQPIPLNVKLYDPESRDVQYIRANDLDDPLSVILGSCCHVPYTYEKCEVGGKSYFDPGVKESIGYDYIRLRHPESKIIFILNQNESEYIKRNLASFLEGIFANFMYGTGHIKMSLEKEEQFKADLNKMIIDEKSYIVSPDRDLKINSSITNKKQLMRIYEAGKDKGYQIVGTILYR